MAKYWEPDDKDGFDIDYMKVWIITALNNGATSHQMEEAACILDTPINKNKLVQVIQSGRKPSNQKVTYYDIEELARILIDCSFCYSEGKYYQYGTDDGKPLYEDSVYGG